MPAPISKFCANPLCTRKTENLLLDPPCLHIYSIRFVAPN